MCIRDSGVPASQRASMYAWITQSARDAVNASLDLNQSAAAPDRPVCKFWKESEPHGVMFTSEDEMQRFVMERAGRHSARLSQLLCGTGTQGMMNVSNATGVLPLECWREKCGQETVCDGDSACTQMVACVTGCGRNESCTIACLQRDEQAAGGNPLWSCGWEKCWRPLSPPPQLRREEDVEEDGELRHVNVGCSISRAILDQYTGVVLTSGSPNWDYVIRVNRSQLDSSIEGGPGLGSLSTSVPSTDTLTRPFQAGVGDGWKGYAVSGFIWLQSALNRFILDSAGRNDTLPLIPLTASGHYAAFPTPAYIFNKFISVLFPVNGSSFAGFLLQCFFVVSIGQLSKGVVHEKERRLREGLAMMGLESTVYWAHWVLLYLGLYACMTAMLSLVCHWGLFVYSSVSVLFVFFLAYLLTLLSFSLLMSIFFTRASVAATVSMIANLSLFFVTKFHTDSKNLNLLLSLISPVAFSKGLGVIGAAEAGQVGVSWSNISSETGVTGALTLTEVIVMLLAGMLLNLALALYLDQVVPQEFGTHRHPFFLCSPSFWKQSSTHPEDYTALAEDEDEDFEDDTQAEAIELIEVRPICSPRTSSEPGTPSGDLESTPPELFGNVGISAQGLRKEYSTADGDVRVAVACLELDFFEGQISVILGHNGAGKTTTINMLTGMCSPTSGDAKVNGFSVVRSMDAVRANLGVCPQYDILFDPLTVEEHLALYAELKGVDHDEVALQVDAVVKSVDLGYKRAAYVSELSGGMKRKLSVGIALIGGSKVCFFDEPSSGMDPSSRRKIWEVLKQARKGRTIVLTTHFMDEADVLGDRIAILSAGRLRAAGTPHFLKGRFGVGYTLTLVQEPGTSSPGKSLSLIHI
eukprot:TRINITY_DN3172_c0_g1_i3.p1 TRINITY_DN3172_c0_g1~~TRINITY_DN3172_c0_g1_i3.p1  ORF type:complete len:865 (-),score=167.46 TRINITY_DN3172_c0_g1_i3:2-2596(-)